MRLHRDLRQSIECLNSNKVEYLIVGALAVSWHGFTRYSADIDFLVRPSDQNARLVVQSIKEFGLGSLGITPKDFMVPNQVVQLGHEPNRIDILTSITGVSFEDAWSTRTPGDLDELPVDFIGREALLQNKESTGRNKDRIDAGELRRLGPKR